MKALVFHHNLAREAFSKIGGAVDHRAFVARFSPVSLEDIPEPVSPGPGWVGCDTVVTGICGSDAKQIFLNGARDNPITALISFPHVLGHEVVATRRDDGRRVVVNPWLSCGPRGIDPPCPACAEGRYPWCRNFTSGMLDAGIHLGNCAGAPGAHAERFYAHEEQMFPLPDGMDEETAVLSDPAAVSLRTILLAPPPPGRPVLVYGSGTLALAAVGLLETLYPDNEVWLACLPGPAAGIAARLGAEASFRSEPENVVAEVARRCGARPLRPWNGKEWLQDGPAVVYDTVGSPETVETSLRVLDTGGSLVISGVEPPARFEWTPLYFKELHVVGSNAFGVEDVNGVQKHAFEHYFDLAGRGLDLTPLITHRFRLEQWREAIATIAERKKTGAVKVLLRP